MRIVAFDMGNVLIDYRPERLVEGLAAASRLDPAAFPERELFADLKPRFERGEMTPRAFHVALAARLVARGGRAPDFAEFARAWCGSISPRPGVASLVERVRRAGAPFALWSNTDPLHFAWISPEMPYLARARAIHLSFLAGATKPDPAFYEGALRGLGAAARPGDVIFVDDSPRNVDAARARGIDAFVASRPEAIEAGLASRGALAD